MFPKEMQRTTKLESGEIARVVQGALLAFRMVYAPGGGQAGGEGVDIYMRNKVRLILGDLTKLPFAELPHDEYVKLTMQQKLEEYLTVAIVRALSSEAGE